MKFFVFILFLFSAVITHASLDEVVISTKDRTCSIRYLTTKTKYNWTINVDPKNCQKGWVNGYSRVQLYNPQKEITETLNGFFNEGYWTENFPAFGEIIERNSPEPNVQSLSFILGNDEEANITYIGQLRSEKPLNRSYGPFVGCPDFRILVVISDIHQFENKAFQEKIVDQGLKYAHQYCPETDILALFGADSKTNPDIIFQMQVDTITGDREIIPIQGKKQISKDVSPIEIREEKTDILLSVKPENGKAKVSYGSNDSSFQETSEDVTTENKNDILSHLKILSKATKKPVFGRVILHIKKVTLDGKGIVDLPEEIELFYYPEIKTGWAVVEGTLKDEKMKVSDFKLCKKEWCQDVP